LLDLGGNNGKYSRLATENGIYSVCADLDPFCVEENYVSSKKGADANMLPILLNLGAPSPDAGWNGIERDSIFRRVRPDMTLALALIHHLRIGMNVPMSFLVSFFKRFPGKLIIEFVPKEDPMVKKLLSGREDHFSDYSLENFERSFGHSFKILETSDVPGTSRKLYLLKNEI
jgi:hypothetical protein